MNAKILLYIRDYQLKRNIINLFSKENMFFIECYSDEEIEFKSNLINTDIKIFIYEFVMDNEDKQYENIEKIKQKGYKILTIYPMYKSEYIDYSQEMKIDDLLIHPVDINILKKKLFNLINNKSIKVEDFIEDKEDDKLNNIINIVKDEKAIVENKKNNKNSEFIAREKFVKLINLEITRAKRGNYELSFILIDLGEINMKAKGIYFEMLNNNIRETDLIFATTTANTYILVCPFTKKDFIVNVENKGRNIYKELQRNGSIKPMSKVYVYGLTMGEDGESFEEIYIKLLTKITKSKTLDKKIKENSWPNLNSLE